MCSLKKKKSAGVNGFSEENLVLWAKVLVVPLTWIINNSITNGEFPEMWQEALVTPILKKEEPSKKKHYQPVSCLSVEWKCISSFQKINMESCKKDLQWQLCCQCNKNGQKTHKKIWKQESWCGTFQQPMTYDIMCPTQFFRTLRIYGFYKNACKWFMSFYWVEPKSENWDFNLRIRVANIRSTPRWHSFFYCFYNILSRNGIMGKIIMHF